MLLSKEPRGKLDYSVSDCVQGILQQSAIYSFKDNNGSLRICLDLPDWTVPASNVIAIEV
jgi:hypothetical protein